MDLRKRISKEIMVGNFPKFTKDVNFRIWESPKILSKINEKESTFRHAVVKCGSSNTDLKNSNEVENIIV